MGPGAMGMPLKYRWFHQNRAAGDELQIILDAGDIDIMSEKAVGFDWKRSSKYTLRHDAGKSNCAYSKTRIQTVCGSRLFQVTQVFAYRI